MPTSVLLAVLAAASLLALAPAMVRRYDATERLVAERATSTARVLSRRRRRRTVPGRVPVNAPRLRLLAAAGKLADPVVLEDGSFADDPFPADPAFADAGSLSGSPHSDTGSPSEAAEENLTGRRGRGGDGRATDRRFRPADGRLVVRGPVGGRTARASAGARGSSAAVAGRGAGAGAGRKGRRLFQGPLVGSLTSRPARRRPPATAIHRRRRVLLALILLNVVELVGVALVGPGFWVGFAATATLLLAYVVHLRRRAVASARLRRAQAHHAAWIATQQAAIRREHERRAAERREAARRAAAEREAARRQAAEYTQRYARREDLPGGADRATGTDSSSATPGRRATLRGRPYEHRAGGS